MLKGPQSLLCGPLTFSGPSFVSMPVDLHLFAVHVDRVKTACQQGGDFDIGRYGKQG